MSQETLDKIKSWVNAHCYFPEESGLEVVVVDLLEEFLETLVITKEQ